MTNVTATISTEEVNVLIANHQKRISQLQGILATCGISPNSSCSYEDRIEDQIRELEEKIAQLKQMLVR